MTEDERELQDALWKSIVTELFRDFIQFFIPTLFEIIDFTKEPEFLEQELEKIVRKKKKGRKYTDKLVKVWLKNGKEQWILIHIELQGYHDNDFGERMFTMFYRIFDRFQRKIVALAIFTEGEKDYKPSSFDYNYFFTRLHYEYFTYKIMEQDEESLKKSNNPFAMAVLAGLYTIKTEGKTENRYRFKKELSKLLKEKGYKENKIKDLLIFIDGLMFLPEDIEIEYENELKSIFGGEKKVVSLELTNFYRVGLERGKRDGRDEGIEEGIEKGIEKGREEEKRESVLRLFSKGKSVEEIVDLMDIKMEQVEGYLKSIKQ